MYKKQIEEIDNLFREYNIILKELKKHLIIKSKLNDYLKEDKDSFKLLWKKYILFFSKIRKLISKSRYRKYFIFIDYNKLIIRRYLLIFYLNILIELLNVFWKHERFLRVFLDENFSRDYWYYAKYIYRPWFINLINTPSIFLNAFKSKIDKKLYFMFDSDKVFVKNERRIFTDYQNLYFYIKYRLDKLIMFLSRNIWFVIAHIKFSFRTKWLITQNNLNKYLELAKPWDIFLTRWNWNASNIFIPWFWKHMSMYIWKWFFLKKNFNFEFLDKLDDKVDYIIESTWDWIEVKSIEKLIFKNDYLWVSRTNFKKEKILRSIKNALTNVWKPYDNLFNYHSDKWLVCSELIMKSYVKEYNDDEWIGIKLENIWTWLTYPPNNFIKKLIEDFDKKDSQVFPVFFIDSIEKTQENFISSIEKFLESWKRPKLSLFLK